MARIGWSSAVLLTSGAMGIVAGATLLDEHDSAILACVVTAAGVLAAAGFVLVERSARHPLVPQAARRVPGLRWGAFGSFFNTATTSSSITVATLYVQDELGVTPLRAATLLVTFSILVVLGAMCAPRLITTLGPGRALGLGIVAAGNTLLVAWPHVIGVAVAAGDLRPRDRHRVGRRHRHGHRRRRGHQEHRRGRAQHCRPARHRHRNGTDPAHRGHRRAPHRLGRRSRLGLHGCSSSCSARHVHRCRH